LYYDKITEKGKLFGISLKEGLFFLLLICFAERVIVVAAGT
jgi:hypothetical protein